MHPADSSAGRKAPRPCGMKEQSHRISSKGNPMNTDLAIAQAATLRPITQIAADLGLSEADLELYGAYKAKISTAAMNRLLAGDGAPQGKIVLVTAITPT